MNDPLRKAAEMALDALNEVTGWQWSGPMRVMDEVEDVIQALRTALAQGVVQEIKPYDDGLKPNYYTEPEKWVKHDPVAWWDPKLGVFDEKHFDQLQPLYTAPQAQQPLTDEQIESIWDSTLSDDVGITALRKIARVIEAAHGIGEKK